jgi:Virulence factor BrkB
MIFRYLPDAKIAWRDVWVGATLTAVLFALGKFVLGLYLGGGAAGSAYGAAQFANHTALVDLLCCTNPALWRRVYSGLRKHLRHPR